jgi:SAM-dependent methyltransferase
MSVASHLGIKLSEYDQSIRTFIPDYEEMLGVAAAAVPARTRTIVDLGIGTGALSARCLESAPNARIAGIDMDPAILSLAAQRLGDRASFTIGTFLRTPLPPCDAVVASYSLHHVRTRSAKAALYRSRPATRRSGARNATRGSPTCAAAILPPARQRSSKRGRAKTCMSRSTPRSR